MPRRWVLPRLSFCDGHLLGGATAAAAQGQPLALASGDFDQDGMPDLVSAFGSVKGGTITVHRGNVNALWPYGAALRNGPHSRSSQMLAALRCPRCRTFS
jgi:hypothetical protein